MFLEISIFVVLYSVCIESPVSSISPHPPHGIFQYSPDIPSPPEIFIGVASETQSSPTEEFEYDNGLASENTGKNKSSSLIKSRYAVVTGAILLVLFVLLLIIIPTIIFSNSGTNSSKIDIVSSMSSTVSPYPNITSSHFNTTSSKLNTTSSNINTTSSSLSTTSSNLDTTSSNFNTASPNRSISSSNINTTSYNSGSASPKASITTSKTNIASSNSSLDPSYPSFISTFVPTSDSSDNNQIPLYACFRNISGSSSGDDCSNEMCSCCADKNIKVWFVLNQFYGECRTYFNMKKFSPLMYILMRMYGGCWEMIRDLNNDRSLAIPVYPTSEHVTSGYCAVPSFDKNYPIKFFSGQDETNIDFTQMCNSVGYDVLGVMKDLYGRVIPQARSDDYSESLSEIDNYGDSLLQRNCVDKFFPSQPISSRKVRAATENENLPSAKYNANNGSGSTPASGACSHISERLFNIKMLAGAIFAYVLLTANTLLGILSK